MSKLIIFILLVASQLSFAALPSPFDPIKILTAGDMSAATVPSAPVDLTQVTNFSIQAVATGAPVGTLSLQVSNDLGDCTNVVNWVDFTNSQFAVSGAANFLWNIAGGNYHCVRVLYTKTSGTGSLSEIYGRK